MGAIGSGRKKTHLSTSDCITTDIKDVRGGSCLIDDKVKCTVEGKQLEIAYTLIEEKKQVRESVQLVTTSPPNIGGKCYWMLCPCCQRRVRILYISALAICYPTCRTCLELNYPSQRSSAIERHITYEKYLLSNYGYNWAFHKHHSLKNHYFEITPEYRYKIALSEFERELHLTRLLIQTERVIWNTLIRCIRTLKSDEDKQVYLEHVAKEHGEEYAFNLARVLQMIWPQNNEEVFKEVIVEYFIPPDIKLSSFFISLW